MSGQPTPLPEMPTFAQYIRALNAAKTEESRLQALRNLVSFYDQGGNAETGLQFWAIAAFVLGLIGAVFMFAPISSSSTSYGSSSNAAYTIALLWAGGVFISGLWTGFLLMKFATALNLIRAADFRLRLQRLELSQHKVGLVSHLTAGQ